jgi:signal peptidase I
VTLDAPPAATPEAPPSAPSEQPTRRSRHGLELVVTVALALTLAFAVEALAVKPYRIPSPSMEPTLKPGQRVLVNRLEKRFGGYGVGDIVVFKPPAGADRSISSCGVHRPAGAACARSIGRQATTTFIKRVVAGPGDRIHIVGGRVVRNGHRASEPFIRACDGFQDCSLPTEITIPRGHYFVMGDNRGDSFDSRYWGSIPKSWIIGQAFATYWPPDRLGTL